MPRIPTRGLFAFLVVLVLLLVLQLYYFMSDAVLLSAGPGPDGVSTLEEPRPETETLPDVAPLPDVTEYLSIESPRRGLGDPLGPAEGSETGRRLTVYMFPQTLLYLRNGDTIDVYWRPIDGSALDWQMLSRNVTVELLEPLGSQSDGTEAVVARFHAPAATLREINRADGSGRIGIAWPQVAYGAGSNAYGQSSNDHSLGTGCYDTYVIGGQTMTVEVDCPPPDEESIVSAPDEPKDDGAVAQMMDQLRAADLAFNRPDQMRVGETVTVELALAPKTVPALQALPDTAAPEAHAEAIGLSSDLTGETAVVSDVDYALKMQATLSGQDFNIDPSGPQVKTVLPTRPAKWVWTVDPKRPGENRVLTLSVSALVERDGKDLPPVVIETFTEKITVTISGWDRAVAMSKEVTAVHGALAATGATLIAVIGWIVARLRRKPEEKDDPMELIVTHRHATDEAGD